MNAVVTRAVTSRRKVADAPRDAVWMSNGRLVSHTLSEPSIKRAINAELAELRKDPAALRAYYIKQGFLTPGGKLSKRYGG